MQEKRRIAVLSNVNMNFVTRMLKREFSVYETEGFGNELAALFNKESSYYEFDPQITFFVMDLLELSGREFLSGGACEKMKQWVLQLESLLEKNKIYSVTDGCLWGTDVVDMIDAGTKLRAEMQWMELLEDLKARHDNVRIFPYRQIIEKTGVNNSFSLKTWYLGKILHSSEVQKQIGEEIKRRVEIEYRVAKKVLVLDLDNTLWGGLAGVNDHTPIQLSDDHEGLAYKNGQRVIRYMQENGVILAIASKNNEEDALEIIRNHPHMILRENAFSAKRINWNLKHESIREMAAELNLGTDSFVFWDDNPQERELVKQMLPEVAVPDFPEKCEELADALSHVYKQYFEKAVVTAEDKEKTKQYAENAKRNELEQTVGSFADYLKQLQIEVERVDAGENIARLHQLVNKTNQFNLTTRRYEMTRMQDIVENSAKRVYLYKVKDCFGEYGIVAVIIVDLEAEVPEVEEFAMSCRIMSKNIEYALVEHVEKDLKAAGYKALRGRYIPTAKNKPVEKLYEKLEYTLLEQNEAGEKLYEILLDGCPEREYYAKVL